jgi:LysR family transcriptional regulator, benzoate and cis,cis-muconate-responsive activator of ben and cat genes
VSCTWATRPLLPWKFCPRHSLHFKKAFPRVRVLLHDLSERELIDGLQDGTLELAVMPDAAALQSEGLEFEALRNYPICVALAPTHRFARLKSITLEKVAAEPLIGFRRKEYREYYLGLERIFNPLGIKPRRGGVRQRQFAHH